MRDQRIDTNQNSKDKIKVKNIKQQLKISHRDYKNSRVPCRHEPRTPLTSTRIVGLQERSQNLKKNHTPSNKQKNNTRAQSPAVSACAYPPTCRRIPRDGERVQQQLLLKQLPFETSAVCSR